MDFQKLMIRNKYSWVETRAKGSSVVMISLSERADGNEITFVLAPVVFYSESLDKQY